MTEISAHFGRSVLHLHKRATLSFRPITASCGRSRSYLDGHEGRISAFPAALDLDLELWGRLTGPVTGGGELDPRPGQIQAAGTSTSQQLDAAADAPATRGRLLQTHKSGGAEFPAGSVRRKWKLSLVTAMSAGMT